MAYQVTALYDQESGEAPLKWGKNAVAEGEFSDNAGRVMVDDVLCTPVSWTASEVVFVPVASSRPDGNYSVHFDNEPLVYGGDQILTGDYGYTDYRPTVGSLGGVTIDATAAEWTVANQTDPNPTWPLADQCNLGYGSEPVNRYPINIEGCPRINFTGGVIHSDISLDTEWYVTYCNSAAFRAADGSTNMHVYRLRVEGAWDGLRFNDPGWKVEECYLSNVRDDSYENDTVTNGTVLNTLFEDVFIGGSCAPGADPTETNQTLTWDGVLVGLKKYTYSTANDHDPAFNIQTHGHGFKGHTVFQYGTVVLKNCVWRYQCAPFHSPERWTNVIDHLDDAQSTNNKIIWASTDAIPQELQDTVTNHPSFTIDDYSGDVPAGEAAWQAIVDQWKIDYNWDDEAPGISPEAQAVLDRMAGLSQGETDAIITFVDSQVESGNWAKMDEFICFALNSTDYLTGWKTNTFTQTGCVHSSDGVATNTTSAYVATGLIPASLTHFNLTNGDIGVYVHELIYQGNASATFYGTIHSTTGHILRCRQRGIDTDDTECNFGMTGNYINADAAAGLKGHRAQQVRGGVATYLIDGVAQGTTDPVASAALSDLELYVGNGNNLDAPHGTTRNGRYTSFYIGGDIDVPNLVTHMNTLHTALGVT